MMRQIAEDETDPDPQQRPTQPRLPPAQRQQHEQRNGPEHVVDLQEQGRRLVELDGRPPLPEAKLKRNRFGEHGDARRPPPEPLAAFDACAFAFLTRPVHIQSEADAAEKHHAEKGTIKKKTRVRAIVLQS